MTTCIVTIHGIGFQQPPLKDGTPGYADGLHQQLRATLGQDVLSNDPLRPGTTMPIYVSSHWPPRSDSSEPALARLGAWARTRDQNVDHINNTINTDGAPLISNNCRIAHIALVYSGLEDTGLRLGAAFEAGGKALTSTLHYAGVTSLVRMGIADLGGILIHHSHDPVKERSSLRARSFDAKQVLASGEAPESAEAPPMKTGHQNPGGLLQVLHTLENDVATYVCRDDTRERVRAFVNEALLRLSRRDDVEAIVINAHSQGTVAVYDALRRLPPFATEKIHLIVTAGSPLRKYVDLFRWGADAGELRADTPWINFWDEKDPVADRLCPPASWRRGDPLPEAGAATLFQVIDDASGKATPIAIEDRLVNNLDNSSGGGLQAHNYWDNDKEVIKPLAQLLRDMVGH